MKDFTDFAEGTALAAGILILLGIALHPFFLLCALAASGLFVYLTWADLRQRVRAPSYLYITDEQGDIVGIRCNLCGHSSRKPEDVDGKFCGSCQMHHEEQMKNTRRALHRSRSDLFQRKP